MLHYINCIFDQCDLWDWGGALIQLNSILVPLCSQKSLSPPTDSSARRQRTPMAREKNSTGFSYISEYFVQKEEEKIIIIKKAAPQPGRPLTPPVCWPASAPPWGRAWRPTSRWSCCCWRCACGCWGPPRRSGTPRCGRCCGGLPQWRERAAGSKTAFRFIAYSLQIKMMTMMMIWMHFFATEERSLFPLRRGGRLTVCSRSLS